jgi:uncharacterized HAD superfamily protein
MRIGLDLDGVCYQWDKTVRYMLREILPDSPYTKDGPLGTPASHWDHVQENVAPEHWHWVWTEGVRLGLFRHGHLYPGTIKAVRQLAESGDVVVITHRPQSAVTDTLAWLAFQQLPISGLHLLTSGEPKSSVQPQCDIYLDDKVSNCIELAMRVPGVRLVALMDRPWNQYSSFGSGPVKRVCSWQEFIDRVEELA